MRILFAASECAPFAKAGGLGDVVGALPKALHALGHDVRVVLPRYQFIATWNKRRHLKPLGVPLGSDELWCGVLEGQLPGSDVPVYFIEHDALFYGNQPYQGYGGGVNEMARFALLSRASLQLCRFLDWVPDVIHVHDWPTAWVPVLLNTVETGPDFASTATVMSIHNMAYQPRFSPDGLELLALPDSVFVSDGLEDHGEINPFKGGLYHATMVSTVSPNYAAEIRTPEFGAGLHDIMNFRGADLVGILNGIDEDVWNPATDPHLPHHYRVDALAGKAANKAALQMELGLDERPDVPMIGVVSRLNHQKGTDVLIGALDGILSLDVQVVMLGSGDSGMEDELRHRSHYGLGRFFAWIGYNERLAHRIEAASDMFLMPSRFEPCGLNQMYSQRYGTLPIVRATGGLEDTVEQCDPETGAGTGFKFNDLYEAALYATVIWAVDVYRTRPELFRTMQLRGMRKSMGWDTAAKEYAQMYEWALGRKRG